MRSHRSFLGVAGLLLAASLTAAGAARAGSVEVKLTLPVRARLDLANRHHPPAPFIVVRQEGEGRIEARTSTCSRSSAPTCSRSSSATPTSTSSSRGRSTTPPTTCACWRAMPSSGA